MSVTSSPSCLQQVNGQQGGGSEPAAAAAAAAAAVVAAGDKWKPSQVLTLSILALRPACPPARPPACLPSRPWAQRDLAGGGAGGARGTLLCLLGRDACPALSPPSLQPGSSLLLPASTWRPPCFCGGLKPHVSSDTRQMVAVVRWGVNLSRWEPFTVGVIQKGKRVVPERAEYS